MSWAQDYAMNYPARKDIPKNKKIHAQKAKSQQRTLNNDAVPENNGKTH